MVRRKNKRGRARAPLCSSIVFMALILAWAGPVFAATSTELVEHPDTYDGRTITFTGEVIGDLLPRRDGVWLNVNDDPYSRQGEGFKLAGFNSGQAILAPKELVEDISIFGDYSHRGDIIRVRGVFHKACPDHGGDMMIHAQELVLIKRGFVLEHPISRDRLILLGASAAAAAAALILTWRRSRRRRRTGGGK